MMTSIDTENGELLLEAQTLYKKCSYRESLRVSETLYVSMPSNIDNLILLGAIHFQLRNLSESIFYSQQCLRVDETCADAYVIMGNCMKEMNQIDSAIKFFNKAIRFEPRFPDAYNNLGCALFKQGKVQEAIDAFNISISLDESHFDALCNLGNVYKVLRRPNDAKNKYLHAIRINPQCAVAWSNLGGVFNDIGDHEQSLKCYEQALAIIPEFADALSNMGNALYNLGRKNKDKSLIDKAVSNYERAQALRPDFAVATGNLAMLHIYNNNTSKARTLLRKAALQDPGFSDSLNNLSALYFELGELDECIKLCLRVIKQKPDHYCAYHNLANAMKEKGMFAAAAYAFETANSIVETNSTQSLCGLAALLLESGRAQESLHYLTVAEANIDDENIFAVNHNKGVAFTMLQNKDEAERKYLDQRLIHWKDRSKTLYNLSVLHQRNGDIDKSISYIQDALAMKDDRLKVLILSMKEFLDAVTCNWSDRIHPWFLSQQCQTLESNREETVFHHNNPSNYKTKIRVGYIFDPLSSNSLLKIPHDHDSSKFVVFNYSILPHERFELLEHILEDKLHILVILDELSFALCDDIFRRHPKLIQVSLNYTHWGATGLFLSDIGESFSPDTLQLGNYFIDDELYNTILQYRTSNNIYDLRSKYCICEDCFVYASFSYPYEIDNNTFKAWMNILKKACKSSILLLLQHNIHMEINLKEQAKKCGVNPERLLFINCSKSKDHYVELYSLPDLFLDTISNSSEYPLCEVLMSGTPVISMQNGRNSHFLTYTIEQLGLDDMVAVSLEDYEKLAVTLQYDEEKFINIVQRLDEKRCSEEGPFDPLVNLKWMSCYEQMLQSLVESKL